MKGLLIILSCLASCIHPGSKTSKASDPLIQQITVGETEMTVRYLPKYAQGTTTHDPAFMYFRVLLEKQKDLSLSRDKLLYLNFDIQHDFILATGSDSLLPAICQKIENGKSGTTEYILAFEHPVSAHTARSSYTLIYHDKIFSIGTLAFVYPREVIAPTTETNPTSQP